MLLAAVLVSTLLFGLSSCGVLVQETLTHFNLGTGDVAHVKSVNYPNDTTANQRQTWIIKTVADSVIELSCGDIRLFKSEPCGDYALEIKDNGEKLVKCGLHSNFKYTSTGESLEITLRTGKWARGFVSCDARSVAAIDGGDTTTKKSLFSFLEVPSREIDSSEHGLMKGPRDTTCNCGWANKGGLKIFGGRETKVNEYPFVAGLANRGDKYFYCGSSIITAYHAITAAHCIDDRASYDLIVAEHNTRTDDETNETHSVPVKKVIIHPEYVSKLFHNDIAVLVLESRLEFTKFIGPVCLSSGPLNVEGQYIKIIGWGKTETNPFMNAFLQKVDLRVLPKSTCHALRPHLIPRGSPKQLCAYAKKKSACSGDSGGPLVWLDPETNRFVLVGIVSYGTSNCGDQKPRVSTDATAYIDWIQKIIQATNPEGVTCTKV